MPRRQDSVASQSESSFEITPFQPEARSANELWCQLQPDGTDGSHQQTSISNCQLGHFRVEEQIGRGGMGAVYRAVDTRLDRVVALKVLSPSQSNDFGSVERFRNEARAAARMDHDNIARVYYVGEDQGLWFIAFEFVHGGNVKELIERRGAINPADAVNYALQIAQALRHTDAAGVVHRDIKPSNIIITPSGRAKLVDLGLARKRGPEASHDLTVDGTTLGTFDYISPEQAKDPKKVDVRSDIYSLGCTLYHMLTGEPPYPKGTMLQKLLDHQAKGIPDAADKNPRIPQELSAVVRKMMASEPSDRYASPEQLIDDLRLIAHLFGLKPATMGDEQWVRPRKTAGWELWRQYSGWLISVVLLLITVFVIDYTQEVPMTEGLEFEPIESSNVIPKEEADSSESVASSSGPPASRRVDLDQQPGTQPSAVNSQQVQEGTDVSTLDLQASPVDSRNMAKSTGQSPFVIEEFPFDNPQLSPQDEIPAPLTSVSPPPLDGIPGPPENLQVREGLMDGDAGEATPVLDLGAKKTPAEPFTVMVNGVRRKTYATLEAACTEAMDGASIELDFDGETADAQRPLKVIGKQLRILPAQGRRPTLRFAAPPEWQLGRSFDAVRMIEVSQGSLEIYNLDIQFEVASELNIEQWSLISLKDADELSLKGVSITAVDAKATSVAIVELTESVAVPFNESSPSPMQINVEDCFVRGHGDFLLDRNIDSIVFWMNNVAVALDGTLVRLEGTDQGQVTPDMGEKHVVQLELKNVTAWLKQGLANFDVQTNFDVPELNIDAEDSVIAIASSYPLIKMQGQLNLFDFDDRLEWSDQGTYLQGTGVVEDDPYWQIVSPDGKRNLNRADFNGRWKRRSSVAQRKPEQLIKVQPGIPFDQILAADLELLQDDENPAIGGAIDGTDAGVDMNSSRFRQLQSLTDQRESPPEWP
ncbi:MAG: serine/threonine-protein kinase [Planctomycetaceae bacterium]